MGRKEEGLYLNPEFSNLSVKNNFFDVRDMYARMEEVMGEGEFETLLEVDFITSVVEDLFLEGDISLEFFSSLKKHDGLELTHSAYKGLGDVVELSVRGAKKRRNNGESYERQYYEILGSRKLRRMLKNAEDGEKFVWIYPPGTSENGYKGMSMIYMYEVIGERGVGRRVEGSFLKSSLSIFGGEVLWQRIENKEVENIGEEILVSVPLKLKNDLSNLGMVGIKSLIASIKNESRNFVVGEVDIYGMLGENKLEKYKPQIQESFLFLLKVFKWINEGGIDLNQSDVKKLELAYSLARRSIDVFSLNTGEIIFAEEMWEDFCRLNVYKNETKTMKNDDYWRGAIEHQKHLENRYGGIEERLVGGFGCPSGLLVSLGIGEGLQTMSTLGNEKPWSYHIGDCVRCGCCNVKVGPCNICEDCEKEFDEGKNT